MVLSIPKVHRTVPSRHTSSYCGGSNAKKKGKRLKKMWRVTLLVWSAERVKGANINMK